MSQEKGSGIPMGGDAAACTTPSPRTVYIDVKTVVAAGADADTVVEACAADGGPLSEPLTAVAST
jgi:hypothetical protein